MNLPHIPPPTSFAEGQRLAYGCLAAGAGMFFGLMCAAMVAILMWGGWPSAEFHSIVKIFGWALLAFIAGSITVTIGLMVGGPVGRFKGSASKSGLTWDVENSAPQAAQAVADSAQSTADTIKDVAP